MVTITSHCLSGKERRKDDNALWIKFLDRTHLTLRVWHIFFWLRWPQWWWESINGCCGGAIYANDHEGLVKVFQKATICFKCANLPSWRERERETSSWSNNFETKLSFCSRNSNLILAVWTLFGRFVLKSSPPLIPGLMIRWLLANWILVARLDPGTRHTTSIDIPVINDWFLFLTSTINDFFLNFFRSKSIFRFRKSRWSDMWS